ncbi:MAG TPA: hypothetical protein VE197_14535 [Mycobacterium sp.]|nr:hypothetical protein [Mycobacterium sp.]
MTRSARPARSAGVQPAGLGLGPIHEPGELFLADLAGAKLSRLGF